MLILFTSCIHALCIPDPPYDPLGSDAQRRRRLQRRPRRHRLLRPLPRRLLGREIPNAVGLHRGRGTHNVKLLSSLNFFKYYVMTNEYKCQDFLLTSIQTNDDVAWQQKKIKIILNFFFPFFYFKNIRSVIESQEDEGTFRQSTQTTPQEQLEICFSKFST